MLSQIERTRQVRAAPKVSVVDPHTLRPQPTPVHRRRMTTVARLPALYGRSGVLADSP